MKTKILLLVLVEALLSACTTEKIVLDEMSITEPEQYKLFKNEPISVSTKDSVKVEIINPTKKQSITKTRILKDQRINNYNFSADSLLINDPYFHSLLGIRTISTVKFKGVWDNELGFISERKINENMKYDSSTLGGIIGGIVGSAAGLFLGAIIEIGLSKNYFSASGGALTILCGLAGTVGGVALGSDIFSTPHSVQDTIKEMKEKCSNNKN